MPRYKLTLEYDGRPFVGWQRQINGPSAQQTLEEALRMLDPSAPSVQAAGRTDAGVHATGQVAHCDLQRDWDPFRLMAALNHHMSPAPVAVLTAERAADDFSARFDATEREYLYRVLCRPAPAVLDRGRVWRVRRPLDVEAMAAAAGFWLGRHDFTTFRASQCQANSPIRTLDELTVRAVGDEVHFTVRARSFLHNQVRSFVGTLERVGCGAWTPERAREALAAADRAACGPVAPPDGLYLARVRYP